MLAQDDKKLISQLKTNKLRNKVHKWNKMQQQISQLKKNKL